MSLEAWFSFSNEDDATDFARTIKNIQKYDISQVDEDEFSLSVTIKTKAKKITDVDKIPGVLLPLTKSVKMYNGVYDDYCFE